MTPLLFTVIRHFPFCNSTIEALKAASVFIKIVYEFSQMSVLVKMCVFLNFIILFNNPSQDLTP